MVQTTFNVGNAGSLTTVLQEISSGGTDAAISTAYTIEMMAGVSLTAALNLDAGSSLLLEGSFPFIVPAFTATGTVITDLNLTGTVILDDGVLDNPTLLTVSGITVAGLFSGTVLGTSGDTGDSAINNGIIQSGGTFAAIEFYNGVVQNGWGGSPSALISGVPAGVDLVTSGLVQNGGTIIGTGPTSAAVFLGAGTVDNGQIGDALAQLSGGLNGVVIQGAGVINNDGSIFGAVEDAVFIGSGMVTNGQIGSESALIEGGASGNGVSVNFGVGTVANFGSIIGEGAAGVYLESGGTVTNGAASDPAALIGGAAEGIFLDAAGLLQNYGTVLGDGSDAEQSVFGAFFQYGGTIENLTNAAFIGGLEWGAVVEGDAGFVSNLGTFEATAALGFGVDLTAGGTVVNAAGATISGPYDGVRVSAGAAGAGAVVMNDGTIAGSVAVDFQSGATEAAGTLTNDGLIESTSGDAVIFGTGTERLILQSAGAFVGNVVGGETSGSSTTLELASGTQGTLSGLAGNGGTVTDSAGSFVFSAMGTIAVDAGALWTIAAPGTLNTLENAGVLDISAGAVTVTGSLTNSGSLAIGGSTLIATTGQVTDPGIITVGAGGLLKANGGGISAAGTADIQVGGGPDATLNVTGAGATVNTGGYQLAIGSSGDGSVLVGQGGTVLAGTPFAADQAITIGTGAGATGGLTVTDPGSLVRSVGQLTVGYGGTGSLLIENQATVVTGNNTVDKSEGFDVGSQTTGSGEVTATGTHSALTNTGRFVVGDAGLGSLSIQSGGTVTTTSGAVAGLAGATIANTASASGSSVNVTGTGSTWQVTGSLDVGNAGAGALSITNDATVTAAALDAGIQSTPEGTGQISLSGPGSSLDVSGNATIGDAGSANLSITDGATLAAGNLTIGSQGTGSGAVFLSDTNTVLDVAGTLNVGTALGVGELTLGPNASVFAAKIVLQGVVVNEGGLLDPTEIDITQGQSIVGFGTEGATGALIVNDSLIEASPGSKPSQKVETVIGTIVGTFGTLSGSGELLIGGGGTLSLTGGPVDGSQSVVFGADSGALVVGDIGGFQAVITSFVAGDTIIVDTPGPATFSQNGSVVSVIENGTTLGTLDFATSAMAQTAAVTAGALVDNALCFLAGTLIGTPDGQIPVERLAAGDRVCTAGGLVRPVVWVGHGQVLATRGRRGPATPVIVRKGALGPNVPHTDLRVTKGHAFWFDGVLIPVEFLVNHRSILWDDRAQEVSVYHVELDTHDVLVANGAAAESYRDDGNRWLFQNANAGWDLPAQDPCAPVLTGGQVVDAVWQRLLDACGPRPSVPLTQDVDLHLLVDGARVDGVQTGDVHVFAVDAGASAMRVVSRSAVPQELGLARDPRCLGVAVRRVSIRQGTHFRTVRGDDTRLTDGFHAFEPGTVLRWTDGDATLPAALFAGFSGPCELVIHLGGTASYIDDGAAEKVA